MILNKMGVQGVGSARLARLVKNNTIKPTNPTF